MAPPAVAKELARRSLSAGGTPEQQRARLIKSLHDEAAGNDKPPPITHVKSARTLAAQLEAEQATAKEKMEAAAAKLEAAEKVVAQLKEAFANSMKEMVRGPLLNYLAHSCRVSLFCPVSPVLSLLFLLCRSVPLCLCRSVSTLFGCCGRAARCGATGAKSRLNAGENRSNGDKP
jgi:hypothetical protein